LFYILVYSLQYVKNGSDGTHFTPKSLESFLHKENMNDTGLKFKRAKVWKKYYDFAKEEGLV